VDGADGHQAVSGRTFPGSRHKGRQITRAGGIPCDSPSLPL
jgi:hypothetical protein